MADQLRDVLRAAVIDENFTLAGHNPAATPLMDDKSDAKAALKDLRDELFDLHELMFANEDRSVLLVLQGTDGSGKNGTIKHVVSALNPAGVSVASFTEPTEEEQQHHFLWRVEQEMPLPGHLAVFDRSHYEDLLVPLATGELTPDDIEKRMEDVRAFEQGLIENGTTVIKCLLHLSYDEQRERFLRRLRRPDKRWKFNVDDLETRRLWDDYQRAYGWVVAQTATDAASWYVVPADHKWYRNWAVASLLAETWRDWNLEYPQPDLDLAALQASLKEPR